MDNALQPTTTTNYSGYNTAFNRELLKGEITNRVYYLAAPSYFAYSYGSINIIEVKNNQISEPMILPPQSSVSLSETISISSIDDGQVTHPDDVQQVLDLAGAWSELNWDDLEKALTRIRHENKPTPPIKL